eukprot:UN26230
MCTSFDMGNDNDESKYSDNEPENYDHQSESIPKRQPRSQYNNRQDVEYSDPLEDEEDVYKSRKPREMFGSPEVHRKRSPQRTQKRNRKAVSYPSCSHHVSEGFQQSQARLKHHGYAPKNTGNRLASIKKKRRVKLTKTEETIRRLKANNQEQIQEITAELDRIKNSYSILKKTNEGVKRENNRLKKDLEQYKQTAENSLTEERKDFNQMKVLEFKKIKK